MGVCVTRPRILVVQRGARHRYAIPRMLERRGLLQGLYTDSNRHSILGRFASCIPYRRGALQRLVDRVVSGVPPEKIISLDSAIVAGIVRRCMNPNISDTKFFLEDSNFRSRQMICKGLLGADMLYTMEKDCPDFIQWARSFGVRVITDVYISPENDRIVAEEARKFPHWCPDLSIIGQESGEYNRMGELADILLCPSAWVAEGVEKVIPRYSHKVRICPYGSSLDFGSRTNQPIRGRILFSGGEVLRKGLVYLGRAAAELKNHFPAISVRVAGAVTAEIRNDPVCSSLEFLGKLDRGAMMEEYLSADIFILPTLSEGFAGVVAEALAAGCPVIVTRESGAPIIHEKEGLFIPPRSSHAIVQAVERLMNDRTLRDTLAANALQMREFFSEDSWAKRLESHVLDLARAADFP